MGIFLNGTIKNTHYVCLNCRFSRKVWNEQRVWSGGTIPCASCGNTMIGVGYKFTTPRKKDDAAWKKLEWMICNGWRGYRWPTQPKMNLRQTQEFIAVNEQAAQQRARQNKEAIALLERRRAARYNATRSPTGQKQLRAESKRQEKYQTAVLEALANNSASPGQTEPTP